MPRVSEKPTRPRTKKILSAIVLVGVGGGILAVTAALIVLVVAGVSVGVTE